MTDVGSTWQAQGKPCLPASWIRHKGCLCNKSTCSSVTTSKAALSSYGASLLFVPRPHIGPSLNDPTHLALSCSSSSCSTSVCTTVSLPGACLWPLCINVKSSLSLVYCCHYFNIILLILLFSIISGYYFDYYCVFSVIQLCHFAQCSSWSCCVFTHAKLCPSYHLYSVLLYNLRCLMKDSTKWKQKRIK